MPNFKKYKTVRLHKVNYASFANGINADYDENLTPIKYSKCTYNFDYSHGMLKDGIGVQNLSIPFNANDSTMTKTINFPNGVHPLNCAIYKLDGNLNYTMLVFYCSDGKLYYNIVYSQNTGVTAFYGINLTKAPQYFNYNLNGENALIITNDTDGMWVKCASNTYNVPSSPKITSFCMHYERLFVTTSDEPHTLWFSDDLDPTNWNVSSTEAGFITMHDDRGKLIKVLSFNDYVYVFRDYGISRLTAYAKQEEFDLSNLFVSSGKIYANSIVLCGDRVLFLANNGLYQFDGANTYKINLNIDTMLDGIDNASCNAVYHDGCYYLACKLKFDNVEDYAIIKINLANGNLSIAKGINVISLSSICAYDIDKLVAIVKVGNEYKIGEIVTNGKCFDEDTYKYWRSPSTDFGIPYKDKTIKEIYFDSVGEVQIIIDIDGNLHTFSNIDVAPGQKRIKVNLKGKKIAINFASNSSTVAISNPQVIVGY